MATPGANIKIFVIRNARVEYLIYQGIHGVVKTLELSESTTISRLVY